MNRDFELENADLHSEVDRLTRKNKELIVALASEKSAAAPNIGSDCLLVQAKKVLAHLESSIATDSLDIGDWKDDVGYAVSLLTLATANPSPAGI